MKELFQYSLHAPETQNSLQYYPYEMTLLTRTQEGIGHDTHTNSQWTESKLHPLVRDFTAIETVIKHTEPWISHLKRLGRHSSTQHWHFNHHSPPELWHYAEKQLYPDISAPTNTSSFLPLGLAVLGALLVLTVLKAAHAPYRNSKQAPNPFCNNWMEHLKPKPWALMPLDQLCPCTAIPAHRKAGGRWQSSPAVPQSSLWTKWI